MKNNKKYIIIIVIIIAILTFFIPVRTEREWIHDSNIYEVGHSQKNYYNIYGIIIYKE